MHIAIGGQKTMNSDVKTSKDKQVVRWDLRIGPTCRLLSKDS